MSFSTHPQKSNVTPVEMIREKLTARKKELKISQFQLDNTSLSCKITEAFLPAKEETILNIIKFTVSLLKEESIEKSAACLNCGSEDISLYYLSTSQINVPFCPSCFETEKHNLKVQKETYLSEDKNYVQGILGCIIFSIPGILLWIFVAVFLERIAGFMAFAFAMLAMKGYEKFGGKNGTLKKWIISCISMIFVFISNIATMVFLLARNNVPLSETIDVMTKNPKVLDLLKTNLVLSFIVCFFALVWIFISLYNATRFPEIQKSVQYE